MLLPTMTNQEISKEIIKDYNAIWCSSTIDRLLNEHKRERKRLKIGNDAEYTTVYEIKTNSKNKWIIIITKLTLYKTAGYENFTIFSFTYFYSDLGIRVFSCNDKYEIRVFNKHLFARYRERMKLDIPDLKDIIKTFFIHNLSLKDNFLPEVDDKKPLQALIKEGFLLGEFITEDRWFLYKTFISKETIGYAKNLYVQNLTEIANESLLKASLDKDYEHRNYLLSLAKSLF